MSPAYTKAIKAHLPEAIHVFDRFHVMKLFNAKLTDLRRRLYGETKDEDEKEALQLSADLAVAHALREQLYDLWEADDEKEAFSLLVEWIADAEWSKIPEMMAFAKTLRNHWQEIMNYYDEEITTGPLEGLNNKTKTLKRQSYGFRDQEYFKLKILAIHRSRYALVG